MVNNFDSPVNFKIGLLFYDFDKDLSNVRLYKNKAERDVELPKKIEVSQEILVNIPFNNNINLTLNFDIENETEIPKILNYNYAVIQNVVTNEYQYYFISNSSQLNSSMIQLTLNIDYIQSYIYDLEFPLSLINKAHVNRWISNDMKTFTFNNLPESLLFSNDLEQTPTYLATRKKYLPLIDLKPNSLFNNWLIKNEVNWLYVFVNPKFKINDKQINLFKTSYNNAVNTGYGILVAPIYDLYADKQIRVTDEFDLIRSWSWNARDLMELIKDKNELILSIKISPTPPWGIYSLIYGEDYEIEENDNSVLTIHTANALRTAFPAILYTIKSDINIAFISLLYQPKKSYFDIKTNIKYTFNNSEIKNKKNNVILEPSLLNQTVKYLNITDYSGNTFSYDLQKLGKDNLRFFVSESFTPDLTKTYIRYKGDDNSIYTDGTNINYTGLVSSNDMSIPYDLELLKAFLAQNKNFFLQQQTTRNLSTAKTGIGLIAGLAGAGATAGSVVPGLGTIAGALGGAVAGTIIAGLNYFGSQKNQAYTIDNMGSAPDQVQNAQGNYLFAIAINTDYLYFYIDLYTSVTTDEFKAFWKVYLTGTPINHYDNLYNYFYTRKIFNYIEADIKLINGNISNSIKELIKAAFRKGIIFWHQDTIDYTEANYEVFLDDPDLVNKTLTQPLKKAGK